MTPWEQLEAEARDAFAGEGRFPEAKPVSSEQLAGGSEDSQWVEISGIARTQAISWSGTDGSERPVADFTTFERFDQPGMTPAIHVRGGYLEALALQPVDFD